MSSVVLDASAVLAVLLAERGHELVVPRLKGASISAVNYSEVLKKTIERGGALIPTRLYLENFTLEVVPFDKRQAITSAEFWPASREIGLSFADRACLALGVQMNATILTADQRLSECSVPVDIVLIREAAKPKSKK